MSVDVVKFLAGKLRVASKPMAFLLVGAVILSTALPIALEMAIASKYALGADSAKILGTINQELAEQVEYDKRERVYKFNEAGKDKDKEASPTEVLTKSVGSSKTNDPGYALDMYQDASQQGVTITDTTSAVAITLIPQFDTLAAKQVNGRLVYPLAGSNAKLVYTLEAAGLKEDIIIPSYQADELSYKYQLKLPDSLEARLTDAGDVGIYSADPALFGNITFATDQDRAKVEQARKNGAKTHLVFALPAPVVMQANGNSSAQNAKFTLEKNILTVTATSLKELKYPISIDPSAIVATTAAFQAGNAESGVDFGTNSFSRAAIADGSISSWSTTTAFTTARGWVSAVAANGYMYMIGGKDASTIYGDVQYAVINSNGTLGTWTATTSLPATRYKHTSVAYNGYLYVLGGFDDSTALNTVVYAKLNSDGTTGSWTTTASFTTGRYSFASAAYGNYMYIFGGYTGSTYLSDVQYAAINGDGTLGTWTATTSFTTARSEHAVAAGNGYVYLAGGYNGSSLATVMYAKLNTDGTVGTWASGAVLPEANQQLSLTLHQGYLYVTGGQTNNFAFSSKTYYTQTYANGTTGSWFETATAFSTGRRNHASASWEGKVYVIGGQTATSTFTNTANYGTIGSTALGVLSSWWTNTDFGIALTDVGSTSYNGRIYMVGGLSTGNSPTNTAKYGNIDGNGTVTWTNQTGIDTASLSAVGLVAYNGYIYSVGGWNGSTSVATATYAPINGDGSIGSWSGTTALPAARYHHTVMTYNGYIYSIGGRTGTSTDTSTVYYAPLNGDGTIGTWSTTTALPTNLSYHASAVHNGYVYVAGGGTTGLSGLVTTVRYAPLNGDGTVGTWSSTTSFSTARAWHGLVYASGYMFLYGGTGASGTSLSNTQYARVNADGTLDSWTATTSVPAHRRGFGYATANGYIYSVTGTTTSSATGGTSTVYSAKILVGDVGKTSAWTATTSFANARKGHKAVAYNGYLYVTGGYDGTTYYSDVQYAAINSDGTTGTWASAGTGFTTGRSEHAAMASNGYLYIAGGYNGSTLDDVQYAPINSNGTIGSWSTGTAIGASLMGHTGTIYNGYIYVLGGSTSGADAGAITTTRYAPVNSNGSIGSWSTTTAFTTARYYHATIVYNGRMYVMGGLSSASANLSDVQYSTINANGTLGTWSSTTSFIKARKNLTAEAYNGYMYVLGGTAASAFDDVEYSAINSTGSPALWTTLSDKFTNARYSHSTAVYNGYIYLLGGYDGTTYYSDVQYASLQSIAQTSAYSRMFDMDATVRPNKFIVKTGTGATVRVQYRVAGSDGVFGSLQDLGTVTTEVLYSITATNDQARYYWFLLTLDDSYTGNTSTINRVDFYYNPAPARRLRGGKSFTGEALQGLDAQP